jgi:hypothetical protein
MISLLAPLTPSFAWRTSTRFSPLVLSFVLPLVYEISF